MELGGTDDVKARQIIHDLRNALGVLMNYTDLVAKDLADRPDVLDDLAEIGNAARWAAELVGELSTVIWTREEPSG